MLFLVLGKGKTGTWWRKWRASAATACARSTSTKTSTPRRSRRPNLAGVDVVIDFTAPEAAVENMRAVLALGGRIVVGTTGWYAQLDEMKALAAQARRRPALRHQLLHRRAEAVPADGRAGQARWLQVLHRRNAPHFQARRAFRHGAHAQGDHSGGAAGRRSCRSSRIASATPRASTSCPP